MAVNKVIANGKVLIDLTDDTVTAGSLKKGGQPMIRPVRLSLERLTKVKKLTTSTWY